MMATVPIQDSYQEMSRVTDPGNTTTNAANATVAAIIDHQGHC